MTSMNERSIRLKSGEEYAFHRALYNYTRGCMNFRFMLIDPIFAETKVKIIVIYQDTGEAVAPGVFQMSRDGKLVRKEVKLDVTDEETKYTLCLIRMF